MSKRLEKQLASAAMLFAALGDDTRLMLLARLSRDGPASITVLADRFRLTRQGVTKHLQVLEAAGVIAGERVGRERIWSLNPERLALARQHLETITSGWDGALARLQAFCEEEG